MISCSVLILPSGICIILELSLSLSLPCLITYNEPTDVEIVEMSNADAAKLPMHQGMIYYCTNNILLCKVKLKAL